MRNAESGIGDKEWGDCEIRGKLTGLTFDRRRIRLKARVVP